MKRSAFNLPTRALARFMLCKALGLATSVIVAWLAAVRLDINRNNARVSQEGAVKCPASQLWKSWRYQPRTTASATISAGNLSDNYAQRATTGDNPSLGSIGDGRFQILPIGPPPVETPSLYEQAGKSIDLVFGWPTKCLWCESPFQMSDSCSMSFDRSVSHKIEFKRSWIGLPPRSQFDIVPEGLPTGILWRGMLTNTAAYAAAWSLALFLPLHLRRRMSKRAGLCPNCRYELQGLAPNSPCPECGNPTAAQPQKT